MSKNETKSAAAAAAVPVPVPVPVESTLDAKKRIRAELAELVAKEKAELAARRAVGVVGFYGRVPSVIDAIRAVAVESPSATVTVDSFAERAERFFVASNPDRKVSANSSRLYTGEIFEAFRLVGLVALDSTAKVESYRLDSRLVALLTAKK